LDEKNKNVLILMACLEVYFRKKK